PKAGRFVHRGGEELLAIGAKHNGAHRALMADEPEQLFPRGWIPQAHSSIGAHCDNPLAIRAESHRMDGTHMTLEEDAFGSSHGRIPDGGVILFKGNDHSAAIWTESRAGWMPNLAEFEGSWPVFRQGHNFLAGFGVPETCEIGLAA